MGLIVQGNHHLLLDDGEDVSRHFVFWSKHSKTGLLHFHCLGFPNKQELRNNILHDLGLISELQFILSN